MSFDRAPSRFGWVPGGVLALLAVLTQPVLAAECTVDTPDVCLKAGTSAFFDGRTAPAMQYWEMGCKAGQVDACFHFAHHAANDPALTVRRAEVIEWLEAQCAADLLAACTHAGNLLASEAPAKARAYLERACELEDTNACLSAAYRAEQAGDGERAKASYTRACSLGSAYGCNKAGK